MQNFSFKCSKKVNSSGYYFTFYCPVMACVKCYLLVRQIHTSYQPSARSIWQVMDQVFAFLLWPMRGAHGP